MTVRDKPQTRFTRAGDVAIAYQVIGDGPIDLIYISGWLHNIDVVWEHPGYRDFLFGLADKCRVIVFDKRGTGLSDRDVGAPTLEERADDIRAVMAAVGSEKASIFGISEGGSITAMFAACYPEMVRSIVLIGSFPCRAWKPDWPAGQRRAEFDQYCQKLEANWGNLGYLLEWAAPSVADDPAERAFFNKLLMQSASPKSALAITRLNYEIDYRSVLPAIQVPALVLHPEKDVSVSVDDGRYLADNIPNARFEFVKNSDHLPWIGDSSGIVNQITDFVCHDAQEKEETRVLATILMTDIEGSTNLASHLGDVKWKDIIEQHDAIAARAIAMHDGSLLKTMGDGILATFSGPSRAIACAKEIQSNASNIGLTLRAGVHTGECLRRTNDVTGLAVTIAARILELVPGGEVWASGVVKGLVVGSGLQFKSMGEKRLKGIQDDWPLYQLEN